MVLSGDLTSILLNEDYPENHAKLPPKDAGVTFDPATLNPTTNNGVRIGMTPKQVESILGKPSKRFYSKKFQADEMAYYRERKRPGESSPRKYSNYYLFRHDKLYYIELRNDSLGGADKPKYLIVGRRSNRSTKPTHVYAHTHGLRAGSFCLQNLHSRRSIVCIAHLDVVGLMLRHHLIAGDAI